MMAASSGLAARPPHSAGHVGTAHPPGASVESSARPASTSSWPAPKNENPASSAFGRRTCDSAGMPLVHDEAHNLWALGPAAGRDRHALTTAAAPELELPDLRTGEQFQLSSLRGQKVLLLAWASW